MPVYIALLRGINLGGHKRMKMDALRQSFESLGFEKVQTYIQSGNVIFQARKSSAKSLCAKLEAKLAADFGFPVPVLIRTCEEMKQTVQGNPFLKRKGIDLTKLHVTFLWDEPAAAALQRLKTPAPASEQFHCCGRDVFLYLPQGYGTAGLNNNALAKLLASGATTRNWKTVNALYQMAAQCP